QAHGVKAHAEESAAHAAALAELGGDARHRRRGDRQLVLAREPRGADADDAARDVDQRTAREPGIEGEVEAYQLIDLAAAPRPPAPAERAHDAPAGARAVAEREHHLADLERGGIGDIGQG